MLLDNRSEFIPTDLAAVSLGAVPFSIYQTSSPSRSNIVLSDSGARVIIIEPCLPAEPRPDAKKPAGLEHVVVLDGDGGTMTYEELLAVDPDFDPVPIAAEVGLEDPLTLIYTSGTTGPPKGVSLTHGNLLRMLTSVMEGVIDLPDRDATVISWLPAAHIAERGANYYTPVMRASRSTSARTRSGSSSSCRRSGRPGSSPSRASGRS